MSGRPVTDFNEWMRKQERTVEKLDRQIGGKTAGMMIMAGLGPVSNQTIDWNSQVTGGSFYSPPGALNSPDSSMWWIGSVQVDRDGYGIQEVRTYRTSGHVVMRERAFSLVGDVPTFTPWQSPHPTWQTKPAANMPVTSSTPLTLMSQVISAPNTLATYLVSVDVAAIKTDATFGILRVRLDAAGTGQAATIGLGTDENNARLSAFKTWRITDLPAGSATFTVTGEIEIAGTYEVRQASTLLTIQQVE